MPEIEIFFDSSALIAGIISSQGAARALLLLAEDKKIVATVSEQGISEVERNIARKVPKALTFTRELIRNANLRIVRDPSIDEVRRRLDWIGHPADVPILVAAVSAQVDFLATLNSKHFIADPKVAQVSGLRIGTPGDALTWVREQWRETGA